MAFTNGTDSERAQVASQPGRSKGIREMDKKPRKSFKHVPDVLIVRVYQAAKQKGEGTDWILGKLNQWIGANAPKGAKVDEKSLPGLVQGIRSTYYKVALAQIEKEMGVRYEVREENDEKVGYLLKNGRPMSDEDKEKFLDTVHELRDKLCPIPTLARGRSSVAPEDKIAALEKALEGLDLDDLLG